MVDNKKLSLEERYIQEGREKLAETVMKAYITITKVSTEEFMNKYKVALEEQRGLNLKGRRTHRFVVIGEDGKEYSLKTSSLRYQLFYKELNCVTCGLEGRYFLIQKAKYDKNSKYHANLYGILDNGLEMMITKDHIIRKEDGGKDYIGNMQTMCKYCNSVVKN